MNKVSSFLLAFILLSVGSVQAQHKGINFQAVLKKPDGTHPTVSGVTVTVQILDPVSKCILREEEHAGKNISNGYLNLIVGDAGASLPLGLNPSPVLSLSQVMDNRTARSGLKCVDVNNNVVASNQTYSPSNVDRRILRVRMNLQGDDIIADFNMRSVAFAINSEMLNSKTDSDFINVNNAKGVTQNNLENIFDQFSKLNSLLGNTNASGTVLGVNITGHAATATTATNATTATTITGGISSLLPSQTGNGGKYLRTDGTQATWEAAPSGGGGSLSQVGINLPTSVFTNGADITSNGQVSATFKSQMAKTFFAAPAGSNGVPDFRALTTADIASFGADVDARADARITAAKDNANGIAGLDSSTKIPTALLPNAAVFSTSVETAVLKLTSAATDKIQIAAPALGVTSYDVILPSVQGTAGQFLKINSVSGTTLNMSWDAVVAGGGGTLTSVGLSLPSSIFDVSNSPLSADGSISATLKSQNQKQVFAAPSGADGVPLFRSLLVSDISNAGTAALYNVPVTGNAGPTELVKGDDARLLDTRAPIDNSVTTNKIADGSVTDAKIDTMAASKLTGTIDSAHLPAASGSSDGIVNQVAQSFKGVKTFIDNVILQGSLSVAGALSAASATITGAVSAGSVAASGNITAQGQGSFDLVKVADSSATCNGSIEGSLKYNSTSKKMEYCNGTAWAPVSAGVLANLGIGSPSSSLVKSGPVTFDVTYGSGVDTATINLHAGLISLGGTATAGCSVTGVTGAGATRTVTVNGCSGTGTVNISVAAGTASSTTGETAPAAGPSGSYSVDNTGPTAPSSVTLGAVPSNLTNSPTITFSGANDVGGSTIANHQVRILKTSDSSVIYNWTDHTSGADVGSLPLEVNTQYAAYVRALDALGNIGTSSSAINWTSINDPCLGTPSPGQVCTGGAIYLGSLSPGATSGSGTDRYMTTPGNCGDIPAGQIGGGSGASAWPNADFTLTCSAGTDSLTKYWNDGSSNWYDIPGLTNYTSTTGTGAGASNTDQYYGGTNTTNIVAITTAGQGGYHVAARYCDRLVLNGYSDWYLPNRYELNLMWTNKTSVPGLATGNSDWYWASTEYSNSNAWIQRFSDGYQLYANKGNAYRVRCVRRF